IWKPVIGSTSRRKRIAIYDPFSICEVITKCEIHTVIPEAGIFVFFPAPEIKGSFTPDKLLIVHHFQTGADHGGDKGQWSIKFLSKFSQWLHLLFLNIEDKE